MSWSRREAEKETPGAAAGFSLSMKPTKKVLNWTQAKVELVDRNGWKMKLSFLLFGAGAKSHRKIAW